MKINIKRILKDRPELKDKYDKLVVADEWNEKMSIQICEACWVDVLNESPSLGKLFYNKSRNCFIY